MQIGSIAFSSSLLHLGFFFRKYIGMIITSGIILAQPLQVDPTSSIRTALSVLVS